MRIAQVIGTVTLSRWHPSFKGARLRMVVPMSLDDLTGQTEPAADTLVAYDEFGSGVGSRVMISEGAEAAQAFRPALKPVDTYAAGILDHIDIRLPESG